ncbi:hypothetical protein, partial [Vibrio cholerae]
PAGFYTMIDVLGLNDL